MLALGREGAQGRDLGGGEEVVGNLVGVRAAPGVLNVDAELPGPLRATATAMRPSVCERLKCRSPRPCPGSMSGRPHWLFGEAPVAAVDGRVAREGAADEHAATRNWWRWRSNRKRAWRARSSGFIHPA